MSRPSGPSSKDAPASQERSGAPGPVSFPGARGLPRRRHPHLTSDCRSGSRSRFARRPFGRWATLAWLTLALGLFLAGWFARDFARLAGQPAFAVRVPPVDHFAWWESFSEVEQTQAFLDALCRRSIAEVRAEYLHLLSGPAGHPDVDHERDRPRALAAAVERVRDHLNQFDSFTPQRSLRAELLRLLHKSERRDEWLDVFIAQIYADPASDLIEPFINRAQEFAGATGRSAELDRAICHWREIPPALRRPAGASTSRDPRRPDLDPLPVLP